MASHFSTIGIEVTSKEEFISYYDKSSKYGEEIVTNKGIYYKWELGNGIELWGQADKLRKGFGLNPHFHGKSKISVRIEKEINSSKATILDGTFYGWVSSSESKKEGDYPFVIDIPDRATYDKIKMPQVVQFQISAFAHEITAFKDDEAFENSQNEEMKFAAESFIPTGLFNDDGGKNNEPNAFAVFTGHVLDKNEIINPVTGNKFLWAYVKTLGGNFDVVIDPSILEGELFIGGVVSGSFWLSGKIISLYNKKSESIFNKIFKRV